MPWNEYSSFYHVSCHRPWYAVPFHMYVVALAVLALLSKWYMAGKEERKKERKSEPSIAPRKNAIMMLSCPRQSLFSACIVISLHVVSPSSKAIIAWFASSGLSVHSPHHRYNCHHLHDEGIRSESTRWGNRAASRGRRGRWWWRRWRCCVASLRGRCVVVIVCEECLIEIARQVLGFWLVGWLLNVEIEESGRRFGWIEDFAEGFGECDDSVLKSIDFEIDIKLLRFGLFASFVKWLSLDGDPITLRCLVSSGRLKVPLQKFKITRRCSWYTLGLALQQQKRS